MGSLTKMDPNATNQLLNQPNSNPGAGCTPSCHPRKESCLTFIMLFLSRCA